MALYQVCPRYADGDFILSALMSFDLLFSTRFLALMRPCTGYALSLVLSQTLTLSLTRSRQSPLAVWHHSWPRPPKHSMASPATFSVAFLLAHGNRPNECTHQSPSGSTQSHDQSDVAEYMTDWSELMTCVQLLWCVVQDTRCSS